MRAARVSALVTVATLAAGCATPLLQSAAALEPGVQIDPGSPAAKEYVLPVGQARRTGSGREGTPSSPARESAESASEPLFGAGVTPPSSGGKPGRGGGRSPGGRGAAVGHRSSRAGGATAQPPPALVRRVADGHGSAGGGSSALVLLAGAVAVLAFAGFAGIVLRHSRRPPAASQPTARR